jgi:hypothetical protein
MRRDDSGLEDELEYFWDAPIPSDSDEQEEDRWLSPGLQEPSSEEDEEEVRYLTNLLGLTAKEKDDEDGIPPALDRDAPSPSKGDRRTRLGEPAGGRENQWKPQRTQSRLPRRGSEGGNSGRR